MKLHLIMARAANGVIGKDNAIPWHLSEDMAHFKRLTMGCPVIMGRKTWDSLPARFRPLPGRVNIVLTHQKDWHQNGAQGACSLREALRFCEQSAHAWVIGGAQIYAAAMPLAHSAVVTEIDAPFEGDAFAPTFGPEWAETARDCHTSATGMPYCFVTYTNQKLQGN
jgi:dihydrofolate reductase